MDIIVIECPACSKNNKFEHAEGEGERRCKRCQADLTALIRVRHAVVQLWAQVFASLAEGDLSQAQDTVKSINRLTPLPDDELLVWLLKSVDTDSYQSKMELTCLQEPEQQSDEEYNW